MVVVTVAAVLLGGIVALPLQITFILAKLIARLIALAAFLAVLLGVIYGRGRLRTFCTGGLVAAVYQLAPDLVSSGRGQDLTLAEFIESRLIEWGGLSRLPGNIQTAVACVLSLSEIFLSILAFGLFAVWVRKRIERWERRRF